MSFSNPIVGGSGGELIRESIKSPDFVEGVSGWIIRRDGSAEFNDVNIRLDLTTGSLVVGPADGPQVVITSTSTPWEHGDISFPTNAPSEETPARIRSTELGNLPANRTSLQLFAAEVDGTGEVAGLFINSASNDGTIESTLSGRSQFNSTSFTLDESAFTVSGDFVATDEVLINSNNADANNPSRLVKGRKGGASTVTTISKVSDTAITNADSTSTYLVNGAAYRVDVQIQQRSSVGTSAAGTQRVLWKLWDGAVGGTQLGNSTPKFNDVVGSVLSSYQFSFLFNFTGTTGSRTLNLSGFQDAGADTTQAVVNTNYYMLVTKLGNPAQITGI